VLSLLLLLQAAIGGRAGPAYDSVVVDGIRRGAYSGAALVIGTGDSILYARGYGHLTWNPRSPLVDPDSTLYDLASVTKVLATTTALMILVERGAVRLDAPVVTYVPAFTGAGTEAITVRQLLAHTSGLRADLPTTEIKAAPDGAALLRLVHAETPRVAPGTRVVYSDLNAILLGEIVARAGGKPLDEFVSQEVLGPLQLAETMYRPPARRRGRTAPTGVWHGVPVAGVVNDPSAAKLGGVAGNAGLFSTGRDVARFAQFILRGGSLPGGGRLVRRATIQEFTTKVAPTGSRGERRALAGGTDRRRDEQRRIRARPPHDRAHRLDRHIAVDRS